MGNNRQVLASLAGLAHRALNDGDTGYARNKALIARFFRDSRATEYPEEVRLTLVDSLYSTQVAARRLYGIADIAESLRRAFPGGGGIKQCAADWIDGGFDRANPLYGLFDGQYGVNKQGVSVKGACSLLSKYVYFATGYSFPIYDALGAKYYSVAGKKPGRDFQTRFRVLKEIRDENAVDGFDKLDSFFWLYGKVSTGSFSLVLNKERYVDLTDYARSKPIAAVIADVRAGKNAAELQKIFSAALYEFIQKTKMFLQEDN